jgi:hypothetical protein
MPHNIRLSTKVAGVPHLIGFPWGHLVEVTAVLKKLIEELNGEDLDLFHRLELRDVHVSSSSDVQKDAVNEEEKELKL